MSDIRKLFENPDNSLRGTPFWSWNTKMTPQNIDHIINALEEMGMGGAYMHVRTGLENEYLSRDFFDMIKYSREKFREKGMYTCLYDEDRWPSGMGGGFVTKDHPEFRRRWMVFAASSPETFPVSGPTGNEGVNFSGDRRLLGKYFIRLEDGYLSSYRRVNNEETPAEGEFIRWAWVESDPANPALNGGTYVDTLNPEAVKRFIDITHEAYKKEVGDGFGKDVPTIFSDEPAFPTMNTLATPYDEKFVIMPYTDAFEDEYVKAYGESFIDRIPEIFWLMKEGRMSVTSYRYHDLLCEMFVSAFCDQIGDWCRANNLKYTGHMFREDELDGQTYALGEAMRCYRGFDIPGVDVLSDRRRITTVKQVQSAARQKGVNRAMCEIYGVTNWSFDFRGHKLAGDWQAALGITNRVHHLTWTSMKGNAKRDYPASIGPQSPWYREYALIETYFARVNAAMMSGKPQVRVGVIHPIESYWLYWGPSSQTNPVRDFLNNRFYDLTNWLLFGLIDFDFISEGWLRDMPEQEDEPLFRAGEMKYDVIVVPGNHTMRSTTVERLKKFTQAGGRVIFLENKPFLVDARESSKAAEIPGEIIPCNSYSVSSALQPYAMLEMMNAGGSRPSNLFAQLRDDDGEKRLFISHVYPPRNPDIPDREKWTVSVNGSYKVMRMDALTGSIEEAPAMIKSGKTYWDIEGCAYDSWLFTLVPGEPSEIIAPACKTCRQISLPNRVSYSLDEENVLVLDMAKYAVDAGEYLPTEETRRINTNVRKIAGMKPAAGQPWAIPAGKAEHSVSLRFTINSEIDTEATLAMESPEGAAVTFNGESIAITDFGWFTDLDIRRVCRLMIKKGLNTLTVAMPYGSRSIVENLYLLGNFGVRVEGREAVITALPQSLTPTDISRQNLAFYSANYTLRFPFTLDKAGSTRVQCSFFRAPLIKARVDGEEKGVIAFAPYILDLGTLSAGEHELELEVFGNRDNTFGALHLCDRSIPWKGPNMWTPDAEAFAYEYQIKEAGLLKAPVLETEV